VRFIPEHQLPGWLTALVEAVRVRLTQAGDVFAGLRYHLDLAAVEQGFWIIYLYPAPVLVENGSRRVVLLPRFTVNTVQLLAAFDSISNCQFVANDGTQRDIQGDYLWLRGVYYGQHVDVFVCAEPPDAETPACVFRDDGTVEPYDPLDPTMIATDDEDDDEWEDDEDWYDDDDDDDDDDLYPEDWVDDWDDELGDEADDRHTPNRWRNDDHNRD
jgi:hypothetical protein